MSGGAEGGGEPGGEGAREAARAGAGAEAEAPAARRRLRLFEAVGVELEYMIVDRETLAVRPIADQLLRAAAPSGAPPIEEEPEIERGLLAWSNELVLHVVEMKTAEPIGAPRSALRAFEADVREAGRLLAPLGARLLPGGMHPLMLPDRELVLWPHGYSPVYQAFNRIFDCRGHGWANLQSMHLNLPFAGDAEFGRLHAAVRLALPILPALAASSPLMEGALTGSLDQRLEVYRTNARRIPSVMGRIIPEPVFSEADYRAHIFEPMFRDVAPHDPDGVLRHEWLNSRGAIARFGRGSIEIRVIDVQEAPVADLALAEVTLALLRALAGERWSALAEQQGWEVGPLERVFHACIRDGEAAVIEGEEGARYLRLFGFPGERATAGDLWRHVADEVWPRGEPPSGGAAAGGDALLDLARLRAALDDLLRAPLARRITRALGAAPGAGRIREVYGALADCLARGELFRP